VAFRNQQAFDDPKSRLAATGVDLRRSNAITDPQGRILAHAQTGGMLSPVRHEIAAGAKLFRFGSRTAGVARVAAGAWWLEQSAFDQLFRFAQVWELSIGMAMRLLCLVRPNGATRPCSFVLARWSRYLRGAALPCRSSRLPRLAAPPFACRIRTTLPHGEYISFSSPVLLTTRTCSLSRWSRITRSTPPPLSAASSISDRLRRSHSGI